MWGALSSCTVLPHITLENRIEWLGRSDACHPQSRYPVAAVSKKHAMLERLPDGNVRVTDLSANGTFVNGKLLGQNEGALLHDGDTLSLLIKGVEDPAFNAEESIVYRFIKEKNAPPLPSSALVTKPIAPRLAQVTGLRAYTSLEQGLKLGVKPPGSDAAGMRPHSVGPELSQPEDFVRLIKVNASVEVMQKLRTALATRRDSWLKSFIEIGGLDQLADVLSVKSRTATPEGGVLTDDGECAVMALKCIKVVMGQIFGLQAALETKDFVKTLALCQESSIAKVRNKLPKLLGVICSVNATGHSLVLSAIDALKIRRRDAQRFKYLVRWLSSEEDCRIKARVLTLINIIINFPMDLHVRLSLREEFETLGITDVLTGLDMIDDPALNQQLNIFREEKQEDDLDSASEKFQRRDPIEMVRRLCQQIPTAGSHLSRVLELMLQSPSGEVCGTVATLVEQAASKKWKVVPNEAALPLPAASNPSSKKGASLDVKPEAPSSNAAVAALETRVRAMEQQHAHEMQALRLEASANEKKLRTEKDKELLEKDVEIRRLRTQRESNCVGAGSGGAPLNGDVAPGSPLGAVLEALRSPTRLAPPPPPPPVSLFSSSTPAPPPPPPPAAMLLPIPKLGGGPSAPPQGSPRMLLKPSTATPGVAATSGQGVKMRKLHMPKVLANRIPGTVWESDRVDCANLLNGSLAGELESLFAQKNVSASRIGASAPSINPDTTDTKVRFFDSKRANNIGIMMTSMFKGVDVLGLVAALRQCDEGMLTLERLTQLLKLCPNEEEEALLVGYEGPLDRLGKVELFFLNLLAVPRLRSRLQALEFKLLFDEKSCDVYARLESVAAGSREIGSSAALVSALQLVLAMGNYMNSGNFRVADCRGFDLTFLARLEDTKSTNDKTTFLHFLTLVMERQGLVHALGDELRTVEAASLVALDATMGDLNLLRQGLESIMKEVQVVQQEAFAGDDFPKVFLEFYRDANSVLQTCMQLAETIRQGTVDLKSKFGLATTTPVEDIFAAVNHFLLGVQKCVKDNAREERLKALAEKKAQQQQAKKGRPNNGTHPIQAEVKGAQKDAATLRFIKNHDVDTPGATVDPADVTMDENSNVTFNMSDAGPLTPKRKNDTIAATYKALQEGCMTGRRRKSAEGHQQDRRALKAQASEQQVAAFKKAKSFQVK